MGVLIIFAGDVVTTARDDAHPQHTTNTQNKTKQNKTKKPQKAVGIGLLTGALFFQLPITPAGGRSVFGAAYLFVLFMVIGNTPSLVSVLETKDVWLKHRDNYFYSPVVHVRRRCCWCFCCLFSHVFCLSQCTLHTTHKQLTTTSNNQNNPNKTHNKHNQTGALAQRVSGAALDRRRHHLLHHRLLHGRLLR